MTNRLLKISSSLLFLLFVVPGWATKLTANGGKVEFLAVGKPSFIKIRGEGAAPKGHFEIKDQKVSGLVEFDLKSLDTGIDLRNEHMKEKYLEIGKHPKAILQLQELPLANSWSWNSSVISNASFTGSLTLHGVTRVVNGTFKMTESKQIMAEFKIKLTDYAIAIPSHLGITVADDVTVQVMIENWKNEGEVL